MAQLNSTLTTDTLDLVDLLRQQKTAYLNHTYPAYNDRIKDLNKLKAMLLENQEAFEVALSQDFGTRSKIDTQIGDILTTVSGINYILEELKEWMEPSKRKLSLLFQPGKAYVEYQPVGVVGIIVPWNFPLFLSLGPLATALAAGNRVMMKMSEFTPRTNRLLIRLLEQNFNSNQVIAVEGDAEVAASFSRLKFDHLFFTGSTNVGRKVMLEAAQNLVPVTLELGGKSPCIIDDEIDLSVAVDRFIFGKTLNSGQACVAPDYIFCPRERIHALTETIQARYSKMYPDFEKNPDVSSIVTDHHYKRLEDALEEVRKDGAQVIPLAPVHSELTKASRKMPLTLVLDAKEHHTVLREEVFGPILPIVAYDEIEDAISYINRHDRPLALYIYSFNDEFQELITKSTHSGGVAINDAAFQVAVEDLPFGGIGASGMGKSHGIEGFRTFSHAKSVLKRGKVTMGTQLFPPFGNLIHKSIFKMFVR